MVVTHRLEVGMQHGVLWRDSLSVVIPQHLAEQVESLIRHQLVVLRIDEFGPWLALDGVVRQQVLVVRVQTQAVLVQVGVQLLRSQHFCDFDKLVVVVASLEEWFSLEDHASKHAAE